MELTQERVKALFDYEPETGILLWKERPRSDFTCDARWKAFNNKYVGKVAGSRLSTNGKEYTQVCIGVKPHLAHRIIWMWMYGELAEVVDHINGDGRDNRISNIRSVSAFENMKNTKLSSRNKTGCIGVSWEADRNKWKASIRDKGKNKLLGRFSDFREAWDARLLAEIDLGYHPNHGRAA